MLHALKNAALSLFEPVKGQRLLTGGCAMSIDSTRESRNDYPRLCATTLKPQPCACVCVCARVRVMQSG